MGRVIVTLAEAHTLEDNRQQL